MTILNIDEIDESEINYEKKTQEHFSTLKNELMIAKDEFSGKKTQAYSRMLDAYVLAYHLYNHSKLKTCVYALHQILDQLEAVFPGNEETNEKEFTGINGAINNLLLYVEFQLSHAHITLDRSLKRELAEVLINDKML